MPLTVYDQRLSNIEPIDFGETETLNKDSKIWHSFDSQIQLVKASHYWTPVEHADIANLKDLDSTKNTKMINIHESIEQLQDNEDSDISVSVSDNDPYRGNSLAIGSIDNTDYIFFPGGDSLCQLVVNQIHRKPIQLQTGHQKLKAKKMPVGSMVNRAYFSVDSPILQIQISIAKNIPKGSMIIGVRTLLSWFIIRMCHNNDNSLNINIMHECKTVKKLRGSCNFNKLSMYLSPYNSNQYVIIEDNGTLFFIDILKVTKSNPNGIIYKLDLNISKEDDSLVNIWKSCVFGPHPYSLITASKKKVELIDFRPSAISPRSTLFECNENDQIYALGKVNSKNCFQYSISTKIHIHLLDVRYPNRPVISWKHQSKDDPPTFIEMNNDLIDPNIVNIFCWSINVDAVTQFQYKYDGRLEYCEEGGAPYIKPAVYSLPQFFSINQQTLKSLGKNYVIPIIGMTFFYGVLSRTMEVSTNQVFLLYRLLNDGSIFLNVFYYIDKLLLDENIAVAPKSAYVHDVDHHIRKNHCLDQITEVVENMKIDERYEYFSIWKSGSFFNYILKLSYISGISDSPNDNTDVKELSKVTRNEAGNMIELLNLDLKQLIHLDRFSLDDLDYSIKEQHFYQPKSRILSRSVFPIPNHISAFDSSLESAKKSATNHQKFGVKQEKVRKNNINHFAKDMFCNTMYYLPLPQSNNSNNNNEQFKYLNIDESKCIKVKNGKKWTFQPTSTTRMLGQEWVPGQLDSFQSPDFFNFIDLKNNQPLFYAHKSRSNLDHVNDTSSKFFSTSLDATSFSTFTDNQDESMSQAPPSVIPIFKPEVKEKEKELLSHMNIATQPEPGAFGNRIKLNTTKKKKKKTLGFK